MEKAKERAEKDSNFTVRAKETSVKAMESYIKEWMYGTREISEENLAFLTSCKNDDEFTQLLKKGHLSL